VPLTSQFDDISGVQYAADVDRNGPARVFHFYIQYKSLNVTFAYDLLAQPEGTDKIKCTFSAFTDPLYGARRKDIPVLGRRCFVVLCRQSPHGRVTVHNPTGTAKRRASANIRYLGVACCH
jgi:hypothetical protein